VQEKGEDPQHRKKSNQIIQKIHRKVRKEERKDEGCKPLLALHFMLFFFFSLNKYVFMFNEIVFVGCLEKLSFHKNVIKKGGFSSLLLKIILLF